MNGDDFPTFVQYNETSDLWTLVYYGEGESVSVDQEPFPEGDFTLVATPTVLPTDPEAGVGLFLYNEDDGPLYLLASTGPDGQSNPVHLKIEYVGSEAHCFKSDDGIEWEYLQGGPLGRPTTGGLVLRYGPSQTPVSAVVAQYRLLDGLLGATPEVVSVTSATREAPPAPVVNSYIEPIIHCIIGVQFGDLEFDVAKSVRWNMYFADRHFILDVNSGDTRYFVVNWSVTFPEAKHGTTGINYFKRPVEFRQEQFRLADKAWNFGDEDWVLWIDGHEGFSVDNTTLPDDWPMEPFQSYVFREVQRAVNADQDWASLPFFVFVASGDVENVEYPIGDPVPGGDDDELPVTLLASQAIAVPYYIPVDGLVRLIKVSALRDPEFDWDLLDQPSPPLAGAKAQIISYAYAHWNLQDIVPPATAVEPLSEANDDGWRMRQKISQVRPVDGLPFASPYKDPSLDDEGLPGPAADVFTYNPIDPIGRTPPVPDPLVAGITTPLYDSVFRLNLRDGVWYEGTDGTGALGNLPLEWDEDTQTWVAGYPPEEWHKEEFVQQVPQ